MDRLWFGTDGLARAARVALAPAERVFAGVSGLRSILYDAGWMRSSSAPIPVVSVGNLTVGGTGKTPIAAWVARWLRDHGSRPVMVLRGYGSDEPAVHRQLNPDIEVLTDPDRARAVQRAAEHGADVAVLDDAFQHRQLRRTVDIVLISADRWSSDIRLLPAGPWREPLSALARAHLVVVTRKAAGADAVDVVNEAISRVAPRIPRVSIHLAPTELIRVDGTGRAALDSVRGTEVVAVAAVGDPSAFFRQLESLGASVTPIALRDHHEFTDADVARIVGEAGASGRVVCTLKDAVKLRNRWPRVGPTLWYVSQRVIVERGVGGIERLLESALRARSDAAAPDHHGPA